MADILLAVSGRHYVENEVFQVENHYLSFAAAVLEKFNYDVKVLDFNLNPNTNYIKEIEMENPKIVVVFTQTNNYDWEPNRELIEAINGSPSLSDVHTAIWVQHPKKFHDYLENKIIQSIYLGNIGEEESFIKYIESINLDKLSEAPATVYLNANEKVKITAPLPLASKEKLNDLPFFKRYQFEKLKLEKRPLNNLLCLVRSSYGCYAKCSFCQVQSFSEYYDRYQWRTIEPKRVVDEMEFVINTYGAKYFYFGDPLFLGPGKKGKKYAKEIAQEIIDRNLNLNFYIYARADTVDDETIKILKEAGLVTVLLGLESFSQTQLNRYIKGTKVETNFKAIDICKKYDIYIHPGFILFDAETTIQELEENIDNLKMICEEKAWIFSKPEKLIGGVLFVTEGTPSHTEYSNKQLLYSQNLEEETIAIEKHGLKRNVNETFIYKDRRVAVIAHACGLVRGEIGRQILMTQKYRENIIEKIELMQDVDLNRMLLTNIIKWQEYLAKFTVETLNYIVQELKKVENFELKQFDILDKVWKNFITYNEHFLGADKAIIHSMNNYKKLKESHLVWSNNK